jgi:hypothetical protein
MHEALEPTRDPDWLLSHHYKKGENSNRNRRQCPMAIKFCREPIKDWVERYSNDDAPDNDRQKWSDQDQRPVSQKSKADYSNYENHEFFIRCTELERSIIVVHWCGPRWFKSKDTQD